MKIHTFLILQLGLNVFSGILASGDLGIDSAPSHTPPPTSLDTKVIYVMEGRSVNILAKAGDGRAIQFCRWDSINNSKVGSSGLIFVNEEDELPSFSLMTLQPQEGQRSEVKGYNTYGAGLSNGECGITIQNVTHEDITTWKYLLIEFSKSEGNPVAVTRDVRLETAVEPTNPQIANKQLLEKVVESSQNNENPLAISCCSENGVPAPQLQFVLDELNLPIVSEQLQNGDSVKQCISTQVNFTRRDNRKTLKCVLEHLTLAQQVEDVADVQVTFLPEILSALTYPENRTIEVQIPEEENSIMIRFAGNPQPQVSWELQNPVSQNFETGLPREITTKTLSSTFEPLTWDSILTFGSGEILNSTQSLTFKITASNDVGSTEIYVVAFPISKPIVILVEGSSDLMWLLIPLIIVIIIILLVIVFLIVARARGWACWRKHVAKYYTNEKDLVYNPVMTTTDEVA